MSESKEQQPLVNAFKDREEREYTNLPNGTHVMGLVGIKNKQKENRYEGGMQEGYQLTFRSKDQPSGFVNQWYSASSNKKSNMYKVMKRMTGGKFKEDCSAQEAFNMLIGCLDKWYTVMTEQNPWKDTVWVNICDHQVMPYTGVEKLPAPSEFFEQEIEVPKDPDSIARGADFDNDEINFPNI